MRLIVSIVKARAWEEKTAQLFTKGIKITQKELNSACINLTYGMYVLILCWIWLKRGG